MIKNIIFSLLLTAFPLLATDSIIVDGHVAGKFTMDLEAAQKYARENNTPILLNFTGSDWCKWCKLMEKNVFEKSKMQGGKYAKLGTNWAQMKNQTKVQKEYYYIRISLDIDGEIFNFRKALQKRRNMLEKL